jgi:IS1 family transposase
MTTPLDKAEQIVQLLVEGCSVRSVERITGVHRDTILRLLVLVGERCEHLLSERVRNVPVKDVQADEIWGFVAKKESHKCPEEANNREIGDGYCFVALERHSKLVLCWELGRRDRTTTDDFISKLRTATADSWFQISTDGFNPYVWAIDSGLSDRADYAQLVKVYAAPREGEQRYSPAEVVEAVPKPVLGNPDKRRICTSHVERQNLSIRMGMRRMTRLTNAFSKKWENLKVAYAIWFAFYNFCRVHRRLRVTPAMEAGIADRVWDLKELLGMERA